MNRNQQQFTTDPDISETLFDAPPWRCSLELAAIAPEETEWLVQDVVPAECAILTVAREGSFKTWLAMDLAKSVADGTPWLGHECQAGAVLYLDAENPGPNFHQRLHAIGGSQNLHIWRWQDPLFPRSLDDPWLLAASQRFRLIVIDTLKRFMGDRDENSSDDMAEITGQLRELTRYGATILVLHHANKDREAPDYRGSSELGAGVDLVYFIGVNRKGKDKILTMASSNKNRYLAAKELSIRVEDTSDKPVFHPTDGAGECTGDDFQPSDLDRLADVMADLTKTFGRQPNQTEIVAQAKLISKKSRQAILALLQRGEGIKWQSSLDGRSRIYDLLSHCPTVSPPRGETGQDRSTSSVVEGTTITSEQIINHSERPS